MRHRRRDGRGQWRAGLVLLLGGLSCFGGDGFEGKQCVVADDCNPALDVHSEHFACIADLCELTLCGTAREECSNGGAGDENDGCLQTCHKYTCGDGIVTERAESCDDGNRDDDDGGCDSDCRKVAVAIGAGPAADHFCALSEGDVRCWGRNGEGQVGRANTANFGDEVDELPGTEVPAAPDVPLVKVVTAESGTCVLRADGTVHCWGLNSHGLLGQGHLEDILVGDRAGELPGGPVVLGGEATDIVAGAEHACALMKAGKVRCWGSNEWNQLGHAGMMAIGDDEPPAAAGDLAVSGVVQVAAGRDHTCVLDEAGQVFCWGINDFGQVGYPGLAKVEVPLAEPVDVGAPVLQLALGGFHTCALVSETDVRCWGDGIDGALGTNDNLEIGVLESPAEGPRVAMLAPGDRVARIYAGGSHTCALLVGGKVRCWGCGASGQLGSGNFHNVGDGLGAAFGLPAIPPLVEVGGEVQELALGHATTCALLVNGQVRCWGRNSEGQLGHNNTEWVGDGPGEMPPRDAIIYRTPGRFMKEVF